jgi:hypothetical protein
VMRVSEDRCSRRPNLAEEQVENHLRIFAV